MNKMILVTIIITAGIFIVGCEEKKEKPKSTKKAQRVEAVAAKQAQMVEMLETTGDVIATNTVTLESTVEGPILYCPWREGDRVEQASQKLIVIDRPLYEQELLAAKSILAVEQAKLADLKAGARPEEIAKAQEAVRHLEDCTAFTKSDYERIRSLVESGSLAAESVEKARVSYTKCQSELDAAKQHLSMLKAGPTATEIAVAQASVEQAESKVALAQAKLDECILKSPFAGIITEVYVREGDLATPRTKLLKMMDPTSLVVRAGLPEKSATNIEIGSSLNVALDAYPGKLYEAIIQRVYPRIESKSRTRIIEAKIVDPIDIMPNMFARLWVRGRVFENALVVPDSAIVATARGEKIVYVVEDGKAVAREVLIGLEDEEEVQVVNGLQAGEIVVTEGNLNLKNGAKVSISDQNRYDDNVSQGGDE